MTTPEIQYAPKAKALKIAAEVAARNAELLERLKDDEICGMPYDTGLGCGPQPIIQNCLRDKGHDQLGFTRAFWPPPEDRAQALADYAEHGYEDRTPY